MKFLEKDLEEILWDQLQTIEGTIELDERGLSMPKPYKSFKQLRIGNYGVSDIVNIYRPFLEYEPLTIEVVELKKDNISVSTFIQAVRYAKGISSFLKKNYKHDFKIEITLIGSSISNGDFIYLTDIISNDTFNLSFYTYKYDLDGLNFKKHQCYFLTEEGF